MVNPRKASHISVLKFFPVWACRLADQGVGVVSRRYSLLSRVSGALTAALSDLGLFATVMAMHFGRNIGARETSTNHLNDVGTTRIFGL